MYTTSTQFNKWTFSSEEEIQQKHAHVHRNHIEKYGEKIVNRDCFFLNFEEEQILLHHYEEVLGDFCYGIKPKIPPYVINTAFHYFKRFYLTTSVMDHHPKEILVTCVYLAAKIEEFYLPLSQVVANIKGDKEKARKIFLDKELVIMEQLGFNMLVHHPFRPIEGFLIDMKATSSFPSPESLRPGVKEFLKKLHLTNAYLLYAPTQIALAALTYSACKIGETIQPYFDILLKDCSDEERQRINARIQKIIESTYRKNSRPTQKKEVIEELKIRLENCRNKVHNFGTQEYHEHNVAKSLNFDEDEQSSAKLYSL